MATGKVNKGEQFNNWTVLSATGEYEHGKEMFKCQCTCGVIRNVRKNNLGVVMGCGCTRKAYKKRKQNTLINAKPPKAITTKAKSENPSGPLKTKVVIVAIKPTRQIIEERLEAKRLANELSEFY